MSNDSFRCLLLATMVLAGPAACSKRDEPALTLRIESLSRDSLNVRVTATGRRAQRNIVAPLDTVVTSPATLVLRDSVTEIHVVVSGFGSARVTLTTRDDPKGLLVSEGRDITLSREPGDQFARLWTVQPLLPL
jgi:hypothetical protein